MMSILVVVSLVLLVICNSVSSRIIISSDGSCKSVSFLEKKFSEDGLSDAEAQPLVGILDPDGSQTSLELCNAVFGTAFSENDIGVSVSKANRGVALRSNFNNLAGPGFSAVKSIELFQSLSSGTLAVVTVAENVDEFVSKYAHVFRSALREVAQQTPRVLVVLGPTSASASASTADFSQEIYEEIQRIYREENGESAAELQLAVASADNAASLARDFLAQQTDDDAAVAPALSPSAIAQKWSFISKSSTPHFDKRQQESLYIISQAYLDCLQTADEVLAVMQKRVNQNNKVVAAFGKKVAQLVQSALADFQQRVQGTTLIVERAQRARDLQTSVLSSALDLLQQQVANQERESLARFRRALSQLYTQHESPGAQLVEQLLRSAAFDHDSALSTLENEALALKITNRQEFSAKLEKEAQEFVNSSAFKLIGLRRAEKQVSEAPKKRRKKKGGWLSWLKVSTTLVGMLRPPGFGNLQGYVNYRSALLGRPLDLLLGVQNDGDAPEILGEDREHPLLRLQPKFHFDIDL